MIELLFLLLPIAVAYGWYMGKRNAGQQQEQGQQQLSEQYVAGLNYLLSDQPDKAVDLFIDMMAVDHDTIETHIALANLFRRRGELERAIKIHQNLIERSHISEEQHNLAILELARDFSAAGLLDRAIELYKKLTHNSTHGKQAIREIVVIFQQMREWEQAIEFANLLPNDNSLTRQLAQFHCELSLDPELKLDAKIKHLNKALKSDKLCVRANIMFGDLYQQQQQPKRAVIYYQAVLKQDIDLVIEVIPKLETCYQQLGDVQEFQSFLMSALEQGAGTSVVIALAEQLKARDLAEDAEMLELTQLRRYPSLRGFFHYMEYHSERIVDKSARESLGTLQRLVGDQLAIKPKYSCRKCGFSANFLHWQCPSCKSWGEIKPVRGLDGE